MSVIRAFAEAVRRQPKFLGLLAATTSLGMAWSFVMPYLSLWGTTVVGLSALQFGLFMTVAATSAVFVSTVLARWSDAHLSRRTTLILGGIGGTLGYAGYAFVENPLLLIVIAVTAVALSAVCFPQLFAHVREIFDDGVSSHSGFFMSVVRVSFAVAWTVGPGVASYFLIQYGFRGMFLAAAALFGLFLVGVIAFVPYRKPTPNPAVRLPIMQVLARRDILAVVVAFAAVFAAHAINMMNLPLMITKVLGGTERQVGIAFCIGPIAEIPMMLWFGYLATKGHQRVLIVWGAVVTVLYFAALAAATEPWHIYLVQILSGASFAILTNVAILYFQDLLPGQTGLGTSIYSNAVNCGNLAGYFGFGVSAQTIGHRGVTVVCTLLAALMLLQLLLLKPRHPVAGETRPVEA